MAESIYWHDYEAFGSDPRRDRASQFAGLRTDSELNVIGKPLMLYCRPAPDMLPHPEACLVTGITPQKALARGLPEAEFMARIHRELAVPGTCVAGYNSIRFDDELTRQTLYRNFFDPYEREWKNGNSRWDIIDMMRLCHAVRPQGIEWPQRKDGAPSFRLEDLTAANDIEHSGAHDALADVRATIALAALVRKHHPKLYAHVFALRRKASVQEQIDLQRQKPFLHVSAMYGSEKGALAPVMPLAAHPVDRNGIIVCDLRQDPTEWLSLDAEGIRARLFVPASELPEGQSRIPLKVLHINRCPVIAPINVLEPERAGRFAIDMDRCRRHWGILSGRKDLAGILADVFRPREEAAEMPGDPDFMLYGGGFFSSADRERIRAVREASPEALVGRDFEFEDARLPEMLFRYRARNWPETLLDTEQERWRRFCSERLARAPGAPGAGPGLQEFRETLLRLGSEREDEQSLQLLQQLELWANELLAFAGSG